MAVRRDPEQLTAAITSSDDLPKRWRKPELEQPLHRVALRTLKLHRSNWCDGMPFVVTLVAERLAFSVWIALFRPWLELNYRAHHSNPLLCAILQTSAAATTNVSTISTPRPDRHTSAI